MLKVMSPCHWKRVHMHILHIQIVIENYLNFCTRILVIIVAYHSQRWDGDSLNKETLLILKILADSHSQNGNGYLLSLSFPIQDNLLFGCHLKRFKH